MLRQLPAIDLAAGKSPAAPATGLRDFPALVFFLQFLSGLILFASLAPALKATENGTTAFPNGGEDFLVAGMPPPGWYAQIYATHYHADFLADDAGNMPLTGFDLKANAATFRLDWVKPVSVFGADRWGTLLIAPVIDLDLALSPAPGVVLRGSKRGLGDLTLGNGLHWTFRKFEMVNAADAVLPTGAYRDTDLVNPGQNRRVGRLSHMGTWHPSSSWDLSYRLHWDYNFNNPATDYRSGQTLYLNWAIGWKPVPPLTLGVAGYFLRQLTDDRQGGHAVGPAGNRARVAGIGPCVKYFFPNHVMLTAKYFRESAARNHPKGDQFWVYAAIPLGSARPRGSARPK